jgi:hypothetical protein
MTIAKCVGEAGGEPTRTAVCAAGRLTLNELNKCEKGIGTDDGCFGPNNSVRQHFDAWCLAGIEQPWKYLTYRVFSKFGDSILTSLLTTLRFLGDAQCYAMSFHGEGSAVSPATSAVCTENSIRRRRSKRTA